MERSPTKTPEPPKAVDLEKIFNHIFENAFGNPIIFATEPSLTQMKANTWGKYGDYLFIKFGDNTLFKISGTSTIDVELEGLDYLSFGDPDTNGTWRIGKSGNNLVFQRRVSGTYVTKGSVTA